MLGNLARPVWGWGPGAIPGPTPQFIGSEPAGYRMAVLFTIMANAKRHHLEPFAYVRDLLVKMSSLCAECETRAGASNRRGTPSG